VPTQSLVYLGNSTPIRDWDLAAIREPRDWLVGVSRGANGIDGQLSTFFGMCRDGRDNWAVLGDLTTLYDLSAPWVLPQLEVGPIRIVVINNSGGQIFSRLYSSPVFLNRHQIGFEAWARMWQLEYQRWDTVPSDARLQDRVVIELCPDADATDRFWQGLDELDRA
jgi:2-succinyl-5-enolpyruvyl-6-hydroxy-3-cyclohexene-1-carboxylate synthase